MQILNILNKPSSSVYYEQGFRILLEDHLTYLKGLQTTRKIDIDIQNAYKYEGDLDGLLTQLNIRPELHFIIMRLNNFTSPQEYSPDKTMTLLIPEDKEIDRIRSTYKTKNLT
jgi:hypothetical protein